RLRIQTGQLGKVDGVHQRVEDRRLRGVIVVALLAHDLGDGLGLLELFEARRGLGARRILRRGGLGGGAGPRRQGVQPVGGGRGGAGGVGVGGALAPLQFGHVAAQGEGLGLDALFRLQRRRSGRRRRRTRARGG